MFAENKKTKPMTESSSKQNIIAQDTKFVGDITSKGPFRIDGQLEGTIKTDGKIVVGKSGYVNGSIEGSNADFEGSFSGKLKLLGTLSLKASAYIQGEVEVGKLSVEPGATFNAVCSMKGAVKELNKTEENGKTKASNTERSA